MTSVVIPAHDEAEVIDRCLRTLLADAAPGEFEVVVVANGCTDDTAGAARRHGVTVLEERVPGKINALNAGDRAARSFPRIYLDADAGLSTAAARAVAAALVAGPALVAAPRLRVVTDGCARLVAWHYQLWQDLPVMRDGYVGSGVYAVSEAGHARIAPFPDVVADDHYVRRRFTRAERTTVEATFDVHPPRTVSGYLHRAVRGRSGNTALDAPVAARASGLQDETAPRGVRALLPLARDPRRWHQVAAFAVLTVAVRLKLLAARGRPVAWNQDRSSRTPAGSTS